MTRTPRLGLSREPADTRQPYIIFNELIEFLEANFFRDTVKSYNFSSRPGASGEAFLGGFYDYETTDANLDEAGPTVSLAGATEPHAAHAFIVSGGNAITDGTTVTLTVTGTSITDGGVRTTSDSEIIAADLTSGALLNTYLETSKKWLGAVTYTLTSDGANFSFDFNYGLAKYDDFGNRNFTVTDFECVGLANANDTGFNVQLLHHQATGWTYAATGFIAGSSAIADMNVDHATESDLVAGEQFAYKRSGLSEAITGGNGEGIIIRVTTGTNNSVTYMDSHVGITYDLI